MTTAQLIEAPRAVSVARAAQMLSLHRSRVYTMIHEGRIAAVKVGKKRYIIPIAAIDALLADTTTRRSV